MQVRGHQEEGEAVGKWRRALLTSTQLSTYYVGCAAVNDLVSDLRAANPGWTDRQVHDAVLAHGSPPTAPAHPPRPLTPSVRMKVPQAAISAPAATHRRTSGASSTRPMARSRPRTRRARMTACDSSTVPHPQTAVAEAALEVATAYSSTALLHHCRRSYVWAAGNRHGGAVDGYAVAP